MPSTVVRHADVAYPRKAPSKLRPRIGLLLSSLTEEYQAAILQGARETARARGAHLLCFVGGPLGSTGRRAAQQNRIYDLVGRRNVDALAVVAGSIALECGNQKLAEYCKRLGDLPICTIAGTLPGTSSVAINNQAGMEDAIAHLIEVHDRRAIAFIRGPETNDEAEQRFEAYRRALADHHLPVDPRLVAPGSFSAASGARAIEILLDERQLHGAIDAVVAADDITAIGAIDALEARKIDVPARVAVVGFDDIEEARYFPQPLTTVRQPIREQGAAAVRLLLTRIEGEVPSNERIVLSTTTVVRRSCGCFTGDYSTPRDSRAPRQRSGFEAELIRRRQVMTAELLRAAHGSLTAMPGWNDQLIEAFTDQLQFQSDRFSKTFRSLLSSLLETGADVSAVHDVITVFRRQMLACLDLDPLVRERAENMLQEVRLITSEAMERVQAAHRTRAERIACVLAEMSCELAAVRTVSELRTVASRGFTELGIQSCYVSVFEHGGESASLLFAHDPDMPYPEAISSHFDSAELAPEPWLSADRSRAYVVMPIHFNEESLGLMAVSLEAPAYVYAALGDMMGVAIDRIRREASTAAVARAESLRGVVVR